MDRQRRTLLHFCSRLAAGLLPALLVCACGSNATPTGTYTLPSLDAASDLHAQPDGTAKPDTVAADAPGADLAAPQDVLADSAPPDVPEPDAPPANTAPQFLPIGPLTLDQGASTTIDLTPLLSDAEDPTGALKLSWSAQHVALKDQGAHVLLVVAPTTWSGTEQIDLTVKDLGGLTAVSALQVTVKEVKVADPVPTSDCGKVAFAIAAGKGQHVVLLSGSFNGWASTQDKADVLTDPGNTGTWSIQKTLAAGVYQYKFIVDGKWMADKANPNQTPDGFGGMNSVIEVAACKP